MKRNFLFSLLLLTSSTVIFATSTEIDLTKLPQPKVPRPLSFTFSPVTAFISETELSVYFESPVGNATITVYDANDIVVSQETVNTNTTSATTIATSTWASGDYTLVITYETTTLSGVFTIE